MLTTRTLLLGPYVFTQRRLLTPERFLSQARLRGLALLPEQLQALHRLGLLVPFYRLRRDVRGIKRAAKSGSDVYHVAHWVPTSVADVRQANAAGMLFDPYLEGFHARHYERRPLDEDLAFQPNVFLYSPYQMTSVPLLKRVVGYWLTAHQRVGRVTYRLSVQRVIQDDLRRQANQLRDAAILASALEPLHYPAIRRRSTMTSEEELAGLDRWRRAQTAISVSHLTESTSADLKSYASLLLQEVDRGNELGDFVLLIGAADPSEWKHLRGPSRSSIDLRVAAELMLKAYETFVDAGLAEPIPPSPPRTLTPFDLRLRLSMKLSSLLYRFDLSSHPQLVLVVEGATEALLLPRVIEFLKYTFDEDFITIRDAQGVDRDFELLAAHLAPRLERPSDDRQYVRFEQAPTRLMLLLDPEGPATTAAARRTLRRRLVFRMLDELPMDLRTPVVAAQIANLVVVTTWSDEHAADDAIDEAEFAHPLAADAVRGEEVATDLVDGTREESFEFANFTDEELAQAIYSAKAAHDGRTVEQLRLGVSGVRAASGNLKKTVLGGVGKGRLAEALWPILERKLIAADAAGALADLAVVRSIDRAVMLAQRYSGTSWVVSLESRDARRSG